MSFQAITCSGGVQIAAAAIAGVLLGALLIKSSLCDPAEVRRALAGRSREVILAVLGFLACGLIFRHLAVCCKLLECPGYTRPAYLWAALGGGVLSGAGLALCGVVPLTLPGALISGRFQAFWALCGMLLALFFMPKMLDFFLLYPGQWDKRMPVWPDPGLLGDCVYTVWLPAGALLLVMVVIRFAWKGGSGK